MATSSLKGLRVYQAEGGTRPSEVLPPAGPKKYWTRRGVAEWLVERLSDGQRTLVGIDHGFSFPMDYFRAHGLPLDWPNFLEDFQQHWPTDEDDVYVDFVREGGIGKGSARRGNTRWRRLTERAAGAAKSVFHFDVQGSVAKSTHTGIPWLRFIRHRLGARVHFWPFDGWDIQSGASVIVEVYPALWSKTFQPEGRTPDQHDAFTVAAWMKGADAEGSLVGFFHPALSEADRAIAEVEGWILGLPDASGSIPSGKRVLSLPPPPQPPISDSPPSEEEVEGPWISVLGNQYLALAVDLWQWLSWRCPTIATEGPDQEHVAVAESAHSAGMCLLAAMSLDSWLARCHFLRQEAPNSARRPGWADQIADMLPETDSNLLAAVKEVAVLRDSLAHNHVWEMTYKLGLEDETTRLHTTKLAEGGDRKHPACEDRESRKTEGPLRLNLVPTLLTRLDAIRVIGTVLAVLRALEDHLGNGYVSVSALRFQVRPNRMAQRESMLATQWLFDQLNHYGVFLPWFGPTS